MLKAHSSTGIHEEGKHSREGDTQRVEAKKLHFVQYREPWPNAGNGPNGSVDAFVATDAFVAIRPIVA